MIPQPPPGQGPIDPQGAFQGVPAAPPGAPVGAPPGAPVNASGASAQGGESAKPQAAGGMNRMPSPMPSMHPQMQMPPMQMAPVQMPPPQMMPYPYPPPPPPRGGGVGRVVFTVLLVLMLLFSAVLNLVLIVSSLSGGGGGIQQQTLAAGGSDKIAVIPLRGVIDTGTSLQFDRFMDLAQSDKTVKAVVIEIDTPGGTVT